MNEPIVLRPAIATVRQTKIAFNKVTVQAEEKGQGISIYYNADSDEPVPRVREDVFVAILQNAPASWMEFTSDGGEAIQVHLPSRSQGEEHRAEGITVFQTTDHQRIRLWLQYGDAKPDSVDLDADQGVILVSALLGILRRML